MLAPILACWARRRDDLLGVVDDLGDRLDRDALWMLDTKYDAVMARVRALRQPPY